MNINGIGLLFGPDGWVARGYTNPASAYGHQSGNKLIETAPQPSATQAVTVLWSAADRAGHSFARPV